MTKPSTMTGTRSIRAARMAPTIAAISRPPSRRSTSSGSPLGADAARPPRPTASAFRFSPASSTPVPRPTQSAGRAAVERVKDRRRDGRVGDPHLAEAEEVDAAGHRLHAVGDRRRAGLFVEGVLDDDVRRRLVERQLEDFQAEPVGVADLVDRRAAGGEVRHHLPRHRLREGGDAARGDAVVGGEDGDQRARPSPAVARPCQAATHAAISSSRPRLPAGLVSTASRARDRRRRGLVRAGQVGEQAPDVVEGQAGRGWRSWGSRSKGCAVRVHAGGRRVYRSVAEGAMSFARRPPDRRTESR